MLSKTVSTATLLLAASSMVSAQTSTKCNPLKKDCPADPAFGKKGLQCDLTSECKGLNPIDAGTTVDYKSKGVMFSIKTAKAGPTLITDDYLFFGRVDIDIQAGKGPGIVTSAVLESDDLDEIDWEFVGGDDAQAQSNYFSKGDDSTFTRGAFHKVSSPLETFHTYSVEWTKDAVNWIIDGTTVRTLKASDVGDAFPQTPMKFRMGMWCGGCDGQPTGTVEWSKGPTDLSQGPFTGYYKNLKIVDYAGGDGPTNKSPKEYTYSDRSGSWKSIKIDGTSGGGDSSSSSSSKPTHTSTGSHSSSTSEASTTSDVSTTMTTAPSTTSEAPSTTSDSGSGSGSGGSSTTSAAGGSTSSSVPHSGASRLAMGGAILAGVAMAFAQLL